MDALSDALRSLRISGSMFIDADLKAPWAVVTPSSRDIACALGNEHDHVIPYHLVTEGECLPQHDWDIQTLAATCAFSRSKFVATFTRMVGSSPMKYLAQWRMILAARDLSDGGVSVKQLAERYRCGSEAAFAKAFRKTFGTPPAAFRRGQHAGSRSRENQEIH